MNERIGDERRRARRRWPAASVAVALLLAPSLAAGGGDAAAQGADAEPSVEALRDAAAAGDAAALFRLADLYERGAGDIEHDLGTAAAYLRLAAERGHPEAQYRLGLLHAGGLGVPEDPAAAYGWLTLAAKAEPEGATGLLAEALRAALARRMAPAEVERGREVAAAFEPVEGAPAGGLPGEAAAPAAAGPAPLAAACDGGDDDLAPSLCRVVRLLADRPAAPDPGMGIVLRGAGGESVEVFEDGDNLIVEVPPPAGDGAARHVAVDYFVHDGNVLHMFPGDAAPPPAGEPLVLGDPATPGGQTWRIGPPFGRDLLAVFVSEDPLHEAPRPQIEPTAAYLDALGPRLAEDGGVRYGYRVVTTLPRRGRGAVASGDEPG